MDFKHLHQEELLRYLGGSASEEEAEQLQGHLTYCDSCAQRLDTLMQIRKDPFAAWNVVEEVLGRWRPGVSPVVESARPGRILVALQVLLDVARDVVALGGAGVTTLTKSLPGLEFSIEPYMPGVGSPELIVAERHRQFASRLLTAGDPAGALDELLSAEASSPGSAGIAEALLTHDGEEFGRVIADSRQRSLHVMVWPTAKWAARPASDQQRPDVSILTEDGAVLETRRLVPVEGARYWIAEFEKLDHQRLHVAIHWDESVPPSALKP